MRIKKMYQGTVPENKILDTYSTSATDTYSCNYVNNKSKYDKLYDDSNGSRNVSVTSGYDFYLVRVGATDTESMVVTVFDELEARYKYVSTSNYSIIFKIQYNSNNQSIVFTRESSEGWAQNVGNIYKIYGVKI